MYGTATGTAKNNTENNTIRQKYGITDRKHKQDSSQSELSIREIIKKYSILETDSKLKLQISSNNKYSSKEVDSEPKI